jgi:hypothetical protein
MRAKSPAGTGLSQQRLQTTRVPLLQAGGVTQHHHSLVTGAPAGTLGTDATSELSSSSGVDDDHVNVEVVARGAVLHVLVEHRSVRSK